MEHIERALAHFRTLLEEQNKRLETLNKPRKDFASAETITIGVVPGDGIGPIIVEQALRFVERLTLTEQPWNELKRSEIVRARAWWMIDGAGRKVEGGDAKARFVDGVVVERSAA